MSVKQEYTQLKQKVIDSIKLYIDSLNLNQFQQIKLHTYVPINNFSAFGDEPFLNYINNKYLVYYASDCDKHNLKELALDELFMLLEELENNQYNLI